MAYFFSGPINRSGSFTLLVCLCIGVLITPVSGYGYSEDYEGYLGEIIALKGESYNSDQVYLFMTGPNLPENGVTLTDMSMRADQGHFTTVDVDSNQQWAFKWDTSRIDNEIDPGTYTVYVVNAPVDKSDLTGYSYQTLSVYLKDGSLSKDRVSVGANYTLRPGRLTDGTVATTMTTPSTAPPTTVVQETTVTTGIPTTVPTPTKKSALLPVVAILATAIAGGICIVRIGD
ncbi:MAG: hypothetical protein PHT99_00740 [Methanoregula sp.]|nr:hypothetical protein [Methanoregula sp.]